VQHDGPFALSIRVGIHEIEAFRQGEVALDVAHCHRRSRASLSLISIWPVKSAIAFIDVVRQGQGFQASVKALVARSQSSSEPMEFSGRVESSTS
jgi:hypothetical protein